VIVTKISARRFARWENVEVTLPTTGIVLVTGRNGHGKSTIVEAVAQGVWGESVRGKHGWRTDEKSGVEIEFVGGHVTRSVSKSSHALKWLVGGFGTGEYPTRTKAQAALESHVGSFAIWRSACTFHTRDASRFSCATDVERKRLLEEVLELDRVEAAYRRALTEVKEARRELTEADHGYHMRAAERDGLQKARDTLAAEMEDVPDIDALRAEGRALKAKFSDVQDEQTRARGARREASSRLGAVCNTLSIVSRRRERIATLGPTCETCEQPIDCTHTAAKIEEIDFAIADAEADVHDAEATVRTLDHLLAQLDYEVEQARRALDENVHAGRATVAAQQRNEQRAEKLGTIDADIAAADEACAQAAATWQRAKVTLAELEAASDALSYQGARASLLDGAVKALESIANDWLTRLGLEGLAVRIASQSESKAGKVTDRISFDVDGAGGGLGYLAASTGEQRRIDIALLLALGELASDARGLSRASTMFADELFDGLDHEGLEAVAAMLRDVSEQRCVVVITHNADLVSRLRPVLHLEASDGCLLTRNAP